MTTPANLIAGLLAASGGHLSVSIVTPLNGSNFGNASAHQITGVAQSTAGNITTLQYQIDGGAWTPFSFTAAPSVSYAGGNAGEIGAGSHVLTVQAVDSAANTLSVSSDYTISAAPPVTSYSWTPYDTYDGQDNYLTIVNATPNATVAFTQTQSDAHGDAVATGAMTTIGTTNGSGNFSYTGTAGWAANAWTDSVQLYVGGVEVASFGFANFGTGPTYSYGPSIVPNGGTITLSIANSWANSTVTQITTVYPSGTVGAPVVLGSTSATGNFSYSGTAGWGTNTSCSTAVYLNGQLIGAFDFTP